MGLVGRPIRWQIAILFVVTACSGGTSDGDPSTAPPTSTGVTGTPSTDPPPGVTTSDTVTRQPEPTATLATAVPSSATTPLEVDAVPIPASSLEIVAYPIPAGSRPHDVAPAADGGVWYTAQGSGELGWLNPATGETVHVSLGARSRPHGVIVGPDGAPWITDTGLNAIVRVDPGTSAVEVFPLPSDRQNANLNTAAFDGAGRLWFTGQNGIHGVLDPASGAMEVYDSPRGRGPYGIATTPFGQVYFASLAGSYVGMVAPDGSVTVLEPPTAAQGAHRVWSDSNGWIWVSEWNSGQLSRYKPAEAEWTTWPLPGSRPTAYAVYVDEVDIVWVSDFGGNAIHRFDPADQIFTTFSLPSSPGDVRQILGREGEVWGAESAADQLVVIRRIGASLPGPDEDLSGVIVNAACRTGTCLRGLRQASRARRIRRNRSESRWDLGTPQ